nr:MAG: GNAT family N-acetyltransferase [Actinomycetota bacterium]
MRTVRPLDETTWEAFAELAGSSDSYPSGCWCLGFHPEGVGRPVDAAANRERKRLRVVSGTTHHALVFEDDLCIGWCQFGTPEELPRIKNHKEYERTRVGDLPDWRITCFYVRRGHRRQGVSAQALAGALELIAAMGGGRVEGYPEPADAVPAGFLFHGALSTFEKLGFTRDRLIGKHRWVVTRTVEHPG